MHPSSAFRRAGALFLALVFLVNAAFAQDDPPEKPEPPPPPPPSSPMAVKMDWRWVKGAVFVPTTVVNEAQEWDQYDPVVNDRQLHYASVYGINCVRVFLYYMVYQKKKDALLSEIEDFLTRADKYHIKVEFVFFDSCWNNPPPNLLDADYAYPAPIYGVHNSQWLKGPSDADLQTYLAGQDPALTARLKSYVQDVVNAHKADPRIAFWETYNEPAVGSKPVAKLMADSLKWIKETGSTIPVTATGGKFPGEPYSDFWTWHQYEGSYALTREPIYSLNTECMNRAHQSVPGIVEHFKDKVGFILWEFGIGRDNCRWRWAQTRKKPGKVENPAPFHGVVYPDGHPWEIADVKALLGDEAFAKAPLFQVKYFRDPSFGQLAKASVTPMIDFDLNAERGTNVPDNTAKIPAQNWSIRWTGTIAAPQAGDYTFSVDGDNAITVTVNGKPIIHKTSPDRGEASGVATLAAGQPVSVQVDYVHAAGLSSLHFDWAGPGVEKQAVTPIASGALTAGN